MLRRCGGLIAQAVSRGRDVRLVILTDGSGSHPLTPSFTAQMLRDLREAEGREEQITAHAAKRLASSVPWGEVNVLIGHPGNITAATGVPVSEGEGLICARAGGSFQVLAETMPNDWARMK